MARIAGPWAYVFIPYGLAFFVLALAMSAAARTPFRVLPRRAAWLLGGFGLVHGSHEWIEMALYDRLGNLESGLRNADLALLIFSFCLLAQAAVEMQLVRRRWDRRWRVVPVVLLVAWGVALSAIGRRAGVVGTWSWFDTADALGRYTIGLPGSLLAAWAFFDAGRQHGATAAGRKARRYLFAAGGAFVVYGIFAGLIAPPAACPPGTFFNSRTFGDSLGIPVEAFRAAAAVGIAGLLWEACLVEGARVMAEWEALREQFISLVVHDLRVPISNITLNASLLERLPDRSHGTQEERSLVERVASSAGRADRMIADLLDACRIDTRQLSLDKKRVDLVAIVRELVGRGEAMLGGHPARVELPSEPVAVDVDLERIEQVLDNLLSNAGRHAAPGTEIVVSLEAQPADVVVSVTNSGSGVVPEERERIFQRFVRGSGSGGGRRQGLGLGLFIVRGLVEAHGGHVWVESEVGRYATFRFSLPRPAAPSADITVTATEESTASSGPLLVTAERVATVESQSLPPDDIRRP